MNAAVRADQNGLAFFENDEDEETLATESTEDTEVRKGRVPSSEAPTHQFQLG
jgi:hypothetical protein